MGYIVSVGLSVWHHRLHDLTDECRAVLETCDPWDMLSEWRRDTTWPYWEKFKIVGKKSHFLEKFLSNFRDLTESAKMWHFLWKFWREKMSNQQKCKIWKCKKIAKIVCSVLSSDFLPKPFGPSSSSVVVQHTLHWEETSAEIVLFQLFHMMQH